MEGRGRLFILFLDDDPSRHGAFARDGRGHRIDHAWFVVAAIARLERARYDLVCLDNDLFTEALRREGLEVASFIAGMPSGEQPMAVLVHSWNEARAREMERALRPFYQAGVTLVRAEFGSFALRGPGPACEGEPDLRRWIARAEFFETSPLESQVPEAAGLSGVPGRDLTEGSRCIVVAGERGDKLSFDRNVAGLREEIGTNTGWEGADDLPILRGLARGAVRRIGGARDAADDLLGDLAVAS